MGCESATPAIAARARWYGVGVGVPRRAQQTLYGLVTPTCRWRAAAAPRARARPSARAHGVAVGLGAERSTRVVEDVGRRPSRRPRRGAARSASAPPPPAPEQPRAARVGEVVVERVVRVVPVRHRDGRVDRLQALLELEREGHVVREDARVVVPVVAAPVGRALEVLAHELADRAERRAVPRARPPRPPARPRRPATAYTAPSAAGERSRAAGSGARISRRT